MALAVAGCATTAPRIVLAPAPAVQARAETAAVATRNADAADDPAIWRNPRDPAASLIVATDKRAGLHVYGLGGPSRAFAPAGRVNNVDLRDMGAAGIIVAASDRNDPLSAKVALYRLDPATAQLTALATLPVGAGEAYGICLYRAGDQLFAFNVLKDGTIHQMALDLSGSVPTGRIVRTMKLATQSEGCVADERTHRLYVGEEDVGVWRFDARPDDAVTPVPVLAADGSRLIADVEGLALARIGEGDGGYLIVSSQGDNAYTVIRLRDDAYVGRFRVAAGVVGSTEETDGLEVMTGDFGPEFPAGMMVVQDGMNAPAAQNFKLVRWDDIAAVLHLPR
ncbi:phytase [Sphingomonas sp. S2-65]|uniref:phytase n=1 Tax=Sphingomonas sp. S2-65 TaxID=2903960 RepID=UPI001F1E13A5|nr:phytase [Sphingomonas sp. S2-65]UYY57880.1 phytase [Sphingomonas sp. S2-65]